MKTYFSLFIIAAIFSIFFFSCQSPNDPATENLEKKSDCVTIQSGLLVTSSGDPITTGYTEFGYNYQAHIYNGDYFGDGGNLVMKWNDAWLSNKSCDGDFLLDRHYGFDTYIGSGAWLTNHQIGTYEVNGNTCHYSYFVKIVAVPEGAYTDLPEVADPWGDLHLTYYTENGDAIGYVIWGQFAVIQEISNDPCAGQHGVFYKSPDHAGFGGW